MNSILSEFHKEEKDGKLYFVYHQPKFCTIPQTQIPTFSNDLHLPPFFICYNKRWFENHQSTLSSSDPFFPLELDDIILNNHLTLYKGTTYDPAPCLICRDTILGSDYYLCQLCSKRFHKECLDSSIKLKHPYHPDHTLQLTYRNRKSSDDRVVECLYCGRSARDLLYHCTICQAFMHLVCATKSIPFVIEQPKNHVHPLTFFPRQTSLTCDVCGLLRKIYPTYVCFKCNFVTHQDCMNYPKIINISRHNHRISLTLSFPSREWSCGVCRLSVNNDYGGYTCEKCSDYVAHPVCATGKKVWDGKELEGLLDEDDITQDDRSFVIISEGVIYQFLHEHYLRLEVNVLYDENKVCQACVLPIYEGNFYFCKEDEFILHEKCAKAPCRIQHALHPHPVTLQNCEAPDNFRCTACNYICGGFYYVCSKTGFKLDIRCASVFEPFDFVGHEDPLFLSLDPEISLICQVCKRICKIQLNCIKYNFIVCFRCITLPYKAKFKHDPHFLKLKANLKLNRD